MLPALDTSPPHQDTAGSPSPAPGFPSGQSPVASCQLPLSDRDRELLRLLRDPAGIGAIDPAEYAAWVERPEIQKAIAAQDDLDDRRQRHRDAAHRAECLADNHLARERLRAVLAATMDLTNDAQRTDHRRAATALGRLSTGAMATPARRGEARRGYGQALRGRADTRVHPAQRPRSSAPSSGQSPAASCQSPSSPPHLPTSPPLQTSSRTFPGLDTTIAAFLAAAGSPDGLHQAAQFVANHRIPEIGPHNLMGWLESQIAPLRGAQFRAGRTIHHARYDAAEQYIHAVHADGALSKWIIGCVLERDPQLNPTRWAIARIDPDTS